MAKIIWTNTITPEEIEGSSIDFPIFKDALCLENLRPIHKKNKELVALPERKAYRSMSRAAVLISAAALSSSDLLSTALQDDPFSVGLYIAVENGPEDYKCVEVLIKTPPEDFALVYKKKRGLKDYLKQLPNLAAAHLGIFLGVRGPMNVYTHSSNSVIHALRQAQLDLEQGLIKYALISTAFSFEDPLLTMRTKEQAPSKAILCEGSAAVVMVADQKNIDWNKKIRTIRTKSFNTYFGIANDLIHLIKN